MPEYFKETSLLHSNTFEEGIRQISNEDQDRPILWIDRSRDPTETLECAEAESQHHLLKSDDLSSLSIL